MSVHAWLRNGLVVLAVASLAACVSNAPPRADREVSEARITPAAAPPEPLPAPAAAMTEPAAEAVDTSPWTRLRARLRMPGCDYSAAVVQRARQFTKSPKAFAASWRPAMPFLLLALDAIERRDLPGEFALLPYVESNYRPLATQGMRPAGVWQLMPHTARAQGLVVDPDYDGRLDMPDATRVALDLLERYDREFEDWRLATMAFNAGEYRLKHALGGRPARALDADALARLKLNPTTHEHLTRLLALACIVADPQRFAIALPEPQQADRLAMLAIEGSVDLRVAARLADLPLAELRRLNAAHLGERSAPTGPPRLLLPRTRIARFAELQAAHPELLLRHWKPMALTHETDLAELARASSTTPQALALANGVEPDARLAVGQALLVPRPAGEPASHGPVADAIHVVRRGDTLSALARRYRVRIPDLLAWNALRSNAVLRLGAQLRVRGP